MGPMYTRIETKLTEALQPSVLEIIDDSKKHAGHAAMKGVTGGETHFRVTAVSQAFDGKMVYKLLDEELKEGLHAISLVTKTPSEYTSS
ncbi:hypothetical protein HKX48_007147 [Thoreauomyces humboldtii]|nr:hypothetical protein HKX48_007147 [Thoreauomyces humboldtii]